MRIFRFKKGFTLIEMMVVVAIIAVSSAIILPAFADMVSFSNKIADEAAASEIEHAIKSTISDVRNNKIGEAFPLQPEKPNRLDTISIGHVLLECGQLRNEKGQFSLLIPKQNGRFFYYDTKADCVVVKKPTEKKGYDYQFDEYTWLNDIMKEIAKQS